MAILILERLDFRSKNIIRDTEAHLIKQSPHLWGFPGGAVIKNLLASAGDTGDIGSVPGLERSCGEGNGNSLQYSCLEKSMNRGA